jgi:hypothetical protein
MTWNANPVGNKEPITAPKENPIFGIPERLGNFVIAYDKVVNSMLPNDLSINFLPVKAGLIAGENDKQAAEKPITLLSGGRCPPVQREAPRCFEPHLEPAGSARL